MVRSVICDILQIFKASVSAVLPKNLIRQNVSYNVINEQLTVASSSYNLNNKNVYLVGTGKAVQSMAQEVDKILGNKIKEGIVSIPLGSLNKITTTTNICYYEGAENNLPDEKSEETAKKVKQLLSTVHHDDIVLVLISGGGSALLPLPREPISLQEKTALIKKLADSGADIKEINTVRKKLSDIKGGNLAIQAIPAQVISLILSDIVGDPLDLIASGPTVENKDEPLAAINIINKYHIDKDLPDSIKNVLIEHKSQKFPKDVQNYIIGSNKISIAAAVEESKKLNYLPMAMSHTVSGNVKEVAKDYIILTKTLCNYLEHIINKTVLRDTIQSLTALDINKEALNVIEVLFLEESKNLCLILGGETTVEVKGIGKGGRNQQLALEYSYNLDKIKDDVSSFDIFFLSAGTDGIDGPTDAAGAIGYLNLIADATKENLNISNFIDNNDSYNFYKQFSGGKLHVITGHTNTNVMDLHLLIIMKKEYNRKVSLM